MASMLAKVISKTSVRRLNCHRRLQLGWLMILCHWRTEARALNFGRLLLRSPLARFPDRRVDGEVLIDERWLFSAGVLERVVQSLPYHIKYAPSTFSTVG